MPKTLHSIKDRSIRIGVMILAALISYSAHAFADATSASYALIEDRFTGGGGTASSTNYQMADTSFGNFSGDVLTSTNYGIGPKAGISAAEGLAVIGSISPNGFAKFYSDSNASYVITAVSEDSDTLQYGGIQDSTTKVASQASSTVSWALANGDIGRHTMSLKAIDPDGTTITKRDAYVVRRPTK